MASLSVWSFAYTLEMAAVDLKTKLFWAKFKYLGIVNIPTAWMTLVAEYTGKTDWLTRRRLALMLIHPTATLPVVWTNEHHNLYWVRPHLVDTGSFTVWRSGFGPLFWVQAVYHYIVLTTSCLAMIRTTRRQPRLFQGQMASMLAALVPPWVANLCYVLHIRPIAYLDNTVFAFFLSSLALAHAMFNFRLLDVAPVARAALIETMSDLVIVLDAIDRVVDLNPAVQQAAGIKASYAVGLPARIVFANYPDLLKHYSERREVESEEVVIYDSNNQQRCFDMHISLLYNNQGRYAGRLLVMHDITERKQAEEIIHQHAFELERRNEELDAFSFAMAHDLSNLLTVVTGYTETLSDDYEDILPPDAQDMLTTIHRKTKTMNSVIENLLLLAHLRDATQTIEPTDITQVIQAAIERMENKITTRQMKVTIEPDIPPALTYGPWIEEVFANLIDNAVKYIGSNNPDPCIRIRGFHRTDREKRVRYEVIDNGLGIQPEHTGQVFQVFGRFHKCEADGFGLGLSIASRILSKLGGDIGVESTPGGGSVFWFDLPAVD